MPDKTIRALLDANVLISYLIGTRTDSAPVIVVEAAMAGVFRVTLPGPVVDELLDRTTHKPYLAGRISSETLARFLDAFMLVAEASPDPEESFLEIGRDRDDDYLYAHAVLSQVDFLVSGDRDVLAVGRVGSVRIVSPATFASILRDAGQL